jgi:hypothetical protein
LRAILIEIPGNTLLGSHVFRGEVHERAGDSPSLALLKLNSHHAAKTVAMERKPGTLAITTM